MPTDISILTANAVKDNFAGPLTNWTFEKRGRIKRLKIMKGAKEIS